MKKEKDIIRPNGEKKTKNMDVGKKKQSYIQKKKKRRKQLFTFSELKEKKQNSTFSRSEKTKKKAEKCNP